MMCVLQDLDRNSNRSSSDLLVNEEELAEMTKTALADQCPQENISEGDCSINFENIEIDDLNDLM